MWMMLSAESMKVVLIGGDNEEELREEVLEDGRLWRLRKRSR